MVSVFGGGMWEEGIVVGNQHPLSKYWGNFLVGIYSRNVLRTGKWSILVSWQRGGIPAQTWLWRKEWDRNGMLKDKGLEDLSANWL